MSASVSLSYKLNLNSVFQIVCSFSGQSVSWPLTGHTVRKCDSAVKTSKGLVDSWLLDVMYCTSEGIDTDNYGLHVYVHVAHVDS